MHRAAATQLAQWARGRRALTFPIAPDYILAQGSLVDFIFSSYTERRPWTLGMSGCRAFRSLPYEPARDALEVHSQSMVILIDATLFAPVWAPQIQ